MIELIIGPAFSGKTTLITRQITEDHRNGKNVILLVPEQEALISEDRLCSHLQNEGVSQTRLEVLNFTRLCNTVFRKYGGISYNSVTRGAKALIMWDALFSTSTYLKHFKNELETADSFIKSLLNLCEELKTYGVSTEALSKAAEDISSDDPIFANKIADISLIVSSYNKKLNSLGTDPSDEITKLDNLLNKHHFFDDINVYIDSFDGFTPQQYSIIRHIFKTAPRCIITLTSDDESKSYCFESTEKTVKDLTRLSNNNLTVTKLPALKNVRSSALEYLSDNLWAYNEDNNKPSAQDNIRAITCSDFYDEAEFVASDIQRKIREGCRYRDFAIIARSIDSYKGILDAMLYKNNIPYRVFDKIVLSEKPLFKLITSALQIKYGNWSIDDVMVYLKTGFSGISEDELYKLQNYTFTWNINGTLWTSDQIWYMNPSGYSDKLSDEDKELLSQVNDIRNKVVLPLKKLHDSLDKNMTVKEICTSIYEFTNEINVTEQITASNSDDEIRIYNFFCEALDTMVNTIPDRKIGIKLFIGLFTIVANETNFGSLPSLVDEVTVGSAGQIRVSNIKHAYILGVNEDSFPAKITENSFFTDNDKAYLETCGINLSPISSNDIYNELFYFYKAASIPQDTLTLTCAQNNLDASALRPSVAFNRIIHLFPESHINLENIPLRNLIQTKENARERIKESDDSIDKFAIELAIAESENSIVDSSCVPLIAPENESLSDEVIEDLFPGNMVLSQSKLDTFVLCAFNYQCKYTLSLKENKQVTFSNRDIGNLIHRILEKFFEKHSDCIKTSKLSNTELSVLIEELLNEYLMSIYGMQDLKCVSKRSLQLFSRLKRTLLILIRNLLNEFEQSEFSPRFFEYQIAPFGSETSTASLKFPLPDGNYATIVGSVDRVDICKKNNDVYVRVVDYKTGTKEFSLSDVAMGLNLQMLLYLFSIWKDSSGSFKRAVGCEGNVYPAGVLYFKAVVPSVNSTPDTDAETVYKTASEKLTRNGLLLNDEEILRFMEKKLENKYIPIKLNKDGSIAKSSLNSLHTLEEMGSLMNTVVDTVSKLAYEIKMGKSDCNPIKDSKHDGCKYCPHRVICRNPEAFKVKKF